MLQLVSRSWQAALADLLAETEESLVVATPYIKLDAAEWLLKTLLAGREQPSQTTILTDISPDSALSASLDVGALVLFAERLQRVTIFDVHRLHAKVYLADDKQALITSGNLTSPAFATNYEYGVVVTDPATVKKVSSDMQDYAGAGRQVTGDELARLNEASRDLVGLYRRSAERVRTGIRRELLLEWDKIAADSGVPPGLHETGSSRFKGPIVEALASHGPLTTAELCQAIQSAWPYLCDDSVMRVAKDGTRKRQWRHDIHTAQETLQRAGVLRRHATGLWHVEGPR